MGKGILPKLSSRNDSSESSSSSNHNFSSDSSTNSSLSSQTSLPSIPSLTPPSPPPPIKAITQNFATLTGHSSYIFSLAFGSGVSHHHHFYSGSSSGEIRRWNTKGEHTDNTVVIAKCDSAVKSISILDDKLLTAHHDHRIRVWKIQENDNNTLQNQKKYKCIATLPTQKDSCMSLFSAKNYVEIRRHKKSTWVHHVDAVSALILTKDDGSGGAPLLYSVSWDRTFKVWRTSDFKCIESVQNAHDDAINAIALCTNNNGFVYTGSADKTIKVWRKQSNKKMKHSVVATLKKHKSSVNALAISKNGCLLYSGACDKSIIVWEKDGGGEGNMVVVGGLRGHKKAILCLSVVEDLVCSGSADKTVRIWKKEKGFGNSHSCLGVLEGHNGPVKCLVAAAQSDDDDDDDDEKSGEKTANNYVVYSGSLDCNIKVWKILIG